MRQSQQPQQPQQPATATFASVALTRRGLQAPQATFASDQAWRSRGAAWTRGANPEPARPGHRARGVAVKPGTVKE